jgi:hypothetical protein
MMSTDSDFGILNAGPGSWAFQEHATRLSRALWLDVTDTPCRYNYVLGVCDEDSPPDCQSFIPYKGLALASDKRLLAEIFINNGVPIPQTHLAESPDQVWQIVSTHTCRFITLMLNRPSLAE